MELYSAAPLFLKSAAIVYQNVTKTKISELYKTFLRCVFSSALVAKTLIQASLEEEAQCFSLNHHGRVPMLMQTATH